ncbi:MAG: alcohol dehydrogenase catalytic domain-containing protein [Chloroflexi bacterium]|nr:alcohol dehydrogenase catalytic domain-containing protein [Chloroflexota bacterium]
MKAVVFRGPGQIACEDVPRPDVPPDGVLLKVTACGICGGDLRAFKHGLRSEREWQILGHEISGVVAEVGTEVTDYAVGDRLAVAADVSCHDCYYCRRALFNLCEDWKLLGLDYPGGMAEYMQLPEAILRRGIVHRLPATLSDLDSALAEPASSVLWAQQTLQVEPSEVVAIIGDGPIGALHVQVARLRGAKPIMIGITGGRLDMFLNNDLGAWHVLDNLKQDVVAEVQALTEGRGADVAIVANPFKETQAQAVNMVRKRGRVGLFGGLPKSDPITHLDSNRIHYDELSVIGNFSYHPSMHATALDLLDRGLIQASKIITASYPLEQVQEAFAAAMNATELKVVLTPGD